MKAIILAAGEGTRMKSETPKVLHKILGVEMIHYVIQAAKDSGASEIILVLSPNGKSRFEKYKDAVSFAEQTVRLGTGHAVMSALSFLENADPDEEILILNGDIPLVSAETILKTKEYHKQEKNAVTAVSTIVGDSTGYGRIVRDQTKFAKIVEHRDANPSELLINEINTGIYIFNAGRLKYALSKLTNDNTQGEYYITDTLSILLDAGDPVGVIPFEDAAEFAGVNTRVELAQAVASMKTRINTMHMLNGVTMIDPLQTYIGPNIEIGTDTIIYPGTFLEGKTIIGSNAIIGPNSKIIDSIIGDCTEVENSVVLDSKVGNFTNVGPFAYIRPHCTVGDHCKIGDFVEIKNSVIGDYTKASHLTYVGDSDVASHINFGCGTVTVNYDGKKKYRCTIEDNAFIGCNTNLIAPVTIKKGAYTAAGSTITGDVPENSLAIARCRQSIIPGWSK